MAQDRTSGGSTASPLDRLKSEARELVGAFGERAVSSLSERVEGATGRLSEYAESGGGPGLKAALTGARNLAEGKSPVRSLLGAGGSALKEKVKEMFGQGGGSKGPRITNIIESVDVGVPIRLAYDQWTRFTDFPSFMRKVENVEQADDQKLNWKAQIFWSHRTWESTIIEQSPEDKIVWRSKGDKGYVDGAVTFHALAPNLTRVLVSLEYHPQGLFERTGNIWRAQGRRVRLELKHYRRHVMTQVLLHPDDVEGWRGVISGGEVQQPESTGDRGSQKSSQKARASEGRRANGSQGNARPRKSAGQRDTASRSRTQSDGDASPSSGRESRRSSSSASRSGSSAKSAARPSRARSGSGNGSNRSDSGETTRRSTKAGSR
jgi:uncharacterized membrane protein